MKVLLLKTIPKVGKKDEIVTVADGYAQHALFPKKWAVPATTSAVQSRDIRLQQVASEKKLRHALLDTTIEKLTNIPIVMYVKSNEQGVLFSKIRPVDVVSFLFSEHHISVDEKHIAIPEIKKIGTYTIAVFDEEYRKTFQLECKPLQ